jgi:hypothetical protein
MTKNEFIKYGDEGADITLSKSVTIDGTEVKALRMREPTVKDQRAARRLAEDPEETEVTLFSSLCGVTADTINNLKMRDYQRLQAAYLGFLD